MKSANKADRLTRSLRALDREASTSRVLNLLAIEARSGHRPEHGEAPLFRNRILNTALVVKHRLRVDDVFLFDEIRPNATKIIIPFERSDLGLGGQSFFVGQRGWVDLLREACNEHSDMARDLATLRLIDQLPSLDPFLLREHLRRHGLSVASSYFALSTADMEQMQSFVSTQISLLIDLAYRDAGRAVPGAYAARLVEALLSTDVDERLEPLRETLVMDGESFKEGVFSWKGFLYYKWMLTRLWAELDTVGGEIMRLTITGNRDVATQRFLDDTRKRLRRGILVERQAIMRALDVYDRAFDDLIDNGRPQAFREFLLRAPDMFLSLGEKVGVVAHIASFWRYRFPASAPLVADIEDAIDLLQDFDAGLSASLAA
ncbi:hypothetical protein [Caulobacter sp. BE254]|uniref:hypothetical protein n=1 Tax=Caulobacter sp. BE254 TaxID=2817720 RepID=UPI0028645568|nr:hypothetical protein [Caulobacter sp. BE254]MDR7115752.1 hypothetical protein [Caulobacter sp. BE254]